MILIRRAWDEVSTVTIRNCFKHCGFVTNSDTDTSEHEAFVTNSDTDTSEREADDSVAFSDEPQICTRLSEHLHDENSFDAVIEEFINMDQGTHTHAEVDCSEIASLVSGKSATSNDQESVNCDMQLSKPSKTEVKNSLEVFRNYLLCVDGGTQQLNHMLELEKFIPTPRTYY